MINLRYLQNKHSGIIFVIGAGPSLYDITKQQIDEICKHTTIVVNSAIVKFKEPDYALFDDEGVKNWKYYLDIVPKSKCIKLLFEDKLKNYASHIKNGEILWFKHKCWYEPSTKIYYPDGLILTKEATLPIIGARTAAASALHFAYIMQKTNDYPIVLLGCDCSYNKAVRGEPAYRYFFQYPGEEKTERITGEPVFSFPTDGIKDGYYVDYNSTSFLQYWDALAKEVNKIDVKVINASGGILNAFERMTLDEVLETYSRQRNI